MEEVLIKCNTCNNQTMQIRQIVSEIPYFGPLHIISMKCQSCGIKASDFFVVEDQPPRRFTFHVNHIKQLNTRVIRSASGKICIPEFNFNMEPGMISKAFITNIEGLLYQVKSTLQTLKQWNPEKLKTIKSIEKNLEKAFEGKFSFTVIIEDPSGKSGMVPNSSDDELLIEPLPKPTKNQD